MNNSMPLPLPLVPYTLIAEGRNEIQFSTMVSK